MVVEVKERSGGGPTQATHPTQFEIIRRFGIKSRAKIEELCALHPEQVRRCADWAVRHAQGKSSIAGWVVSCCTSNVVDFDPDVFEDKRRAMDEREVQLVLQFKEQMLVELDQDELAIVAAGISDNWREIYSAVPEHLRHSGPFSIKQYLLDRARPRVHAVAV